MRSLSLASYGFALGATAILTVVAGLSPGPSAAEQHVILMVDVAYGPMTLRAHIGDSVRWQNQDMVAHTASARDKSSDVNVSPGRSGIATMKTAGTFAYICRYHPNMTGEIVVEP